MNDKIIKKNLELHAHWMRYCFQHPEVLDRIPEGAQIVIVPDNDSILAAENKQTAEQLKAKNLPVVIVHLDLPSPPEPQIEVIAHA